MGSYLCSRCDRIFESAFDIDRTREVRCTRCSLGHPHPWHDDIYEARLRGMTA